ncbi:MAG: right-handed parallel beta-helix repeat-containing protein, partial [Chloroflexi bacterium]
MPGDRSRRLEGSHPGPGPGEYADGLGDSLRRDRNLGRHADGIAACAKPHHDPEQRSQHRRRWRRHPVSALDHGRRILAIKLGGHTVQISGLSVDHAGAFGINLRDADNLTLTNNTVTNSAATYPAIYLNGFTGPFGTSLSPFIFGNKGAGNGIDAIAFHGTVTDNLAWQTARKTADPTQLLGYVLDNTLNMQPGQMLTVAAGDIVKVGNGGMLNLQGVTLR